MLSAGAFDMRPFRVPSCVLLLAMRERESTTHTRTRQKKLLTCFVFVMIEIVVIPTGILVCLLLFNKINNQQKFPRPFYSIFRDVSFNSFFSF